MLVLSNSLGTDLRFWDAQLEDLGKTHRLLLYDTRGHGSSTAPAGLYSLAMLGRDVLALMDRLGLERAAVCGISLGGLTALWLAIHAPERVTAIVAANTAARIGSPEGWAERMAQVAREGTASLFPATLHRWFTAPFVASHPHLPSRVEHALRSTSRAGYIACCAALRDADLRLDVAAIRVPALILTGLHDCVTPPSDARFLAEHIPGAQVATFQAAHLSNVEDAAAFNDAVLAFLQSHNPQRGFNDER